MDILGFSRNLGLKLSRPFLVNPQLTHVSIEWHGNRADNFFSGVKLIDSEYQRLTGSVAVQQTKENQIVYLQQDLTTDISKSSETEHFVKYTGSLTSQRLLSDGLILTFRGSFQLSPDKLLPSAEQFSLGGMASVRGYAEGALTGDQGYLVSFELSGQVSERTTTMVFIDHGGAFPFKGNDEPIASTDYALSVGLGGIVKLAKDVSG